MREAARRIEEAMRAYRLSGDTVVRYIDAVSEMGELGKEILLSGGYGERPPSANDAMREEAGDCLFSLLCLFAALEVDPEEALDAALHKYAHRFARNQTLSSEK